MSELPVASSDYGRVAVLMGGWSAEREVSLNSGQQVLAALTSAGVDAFAVDVARDQLSNALVGKCDRVFNILHGTWGEDGRIQGMLDMLGIAYTGSGVLASALTMDKHRTKSLCHQNGIPTPGWQVVNSHEACVRAADKIGYPVVVKPVSEGSSIGVSIVHNNEVGSAYTLAAEYGEVFVEQFVDGGEITATILDGEALPLIKISTPRGFYDYDAKYLEDSTVYECPCGLAPETEKAIQATALQVFELLKCRDWGRVDFLLDDKGNHYLLEANTVPGMTDHSLVPMAAKASGMDFQQLVLKILALTLNTERKA
jgi:D-alanine-D-alanine ligase